MKLSILLVLTAAPALAQLTRPELISIPDVDAPPGEPDVENAEVTIDVDASGAATIFECSQSEAVCVTIREALSQARFQPATQAGAAIAGRIRLQVHLRQPVWAPRLDIPDSPYATAPPELGVRAEVPRVEPGAVRLSLTETRDAPGNFNDPFRYLLTMPGVVPVLSGLPYFYLRGAPPNGTIYVYDSIPVPALFHLAIGPSLIHPRMVGAIQVHSGIAPARYGSHTGGVVIGEGPTPSDRSEGEVELRALDASAYAQSRVGDLSFAGAVRFGYPGLLVSLFSPLVTFAYGDYQARARLSLGSSGAIELVTLGAYDTLSTFAALPAGQPGRGAELSDTEIAFQRTELRYLQSHGSIQQGLALRVGYDNTSILSSISAGSAFSLAVNLITVAPRWWIEETRGPFQWRIGGEVLGGSGAITEGPLQGGAADPIRRLLQSTLGLLNAHTRTSSNVYAQAIWQALPELSISGGVRADLWASPGSYAGAIDPRLRLSWQPTSSFELYGGFGVARQPAVFALPLPGLSELPITQGLQTAVQSEIGAHARIEERDVTLDLRGTLFLNRFENLLLPDIVLDVASACRFGLCRTLPNGLRADAWAYGLEATIRADFGRYVAARVTYTLSQLQSNALGQLAYTPSYDVRHVFNVVLALDTQMGFTAGIRAYVRSGTSDGFNYVAGDDLQLQRYEQRLPWFARVDASVAYSWNAGWADLRVYLEWFNVSASTETLGLDCSTRQGPPASSCPVRPLPPIFAPNLGIRGSFR